MNRIVSHLWFALSEFDKGFRKLMDEVFPKEDVTRAVEKVDRGEVRFKAVITY